MDLTIVYLFFNYLLVCGWRPNSELNAVSGQIFWVGRKGCGSLEPCSSQGLFVFYVIPANYTKKWDFLSVFSCFQKNFKHAHAIYLSFTIWIFMQNWNVCLVHDHHTKWSKKVEEKIVKSTSNDSFSIS